MDRKELLQRRVRILLIMVIVGLAISGITAFPLESELRWLTSILPLAETSTLSQWFVKIRDSLIDTNQKYPFLAYGTDWLAFAHLAIAVAFIGPLKDPVRNIWVVTFGLLACAGIIPLAFIAGSIRGIPFYWQLIDCSFAVFAGIPLWICRNYIIELEAIEARPGNMLL